MSKIPTTGRHAAAILVATALAAALPSQCGLVADLTPGTANNGNADGMVCAFGRELYWSQYDQNLGSELWKWDATNGALLVVDINPGSYNNNPEGITPACVPAGPRLFYSAFEIGHGHELYMSDGTAAGTGRLEEIRAGSSSSLPWKFTACRERVFFQANDGTHGDELWITDGTSAGTVMLLDIWPNAGNGRPDQIVALNGKIVFTADDSVHGRELWISDGTTAGTELLLDIQAGPTSSSAYELTRVGDYVYFAADDGVSGNELWRTDGTSAGTEMVLELATGLSGTILDDFTACGDRLFFTSTLPGANGIHVYDGATGTATYLGVDGSGITCSGNLVFFGASDVLAGTEPWVSDGTVAGTHVIADINPSGSSNPQKLIAVGTGVVFVARVTTFGEIWFTDGTAAGTTHVCTLDPGGNSSPHQFVMCDGHLFFQGYDPAVGQEMHWLETPGASTTNLGGSSRPDHPTLWVQDGAVPVIDSSIDLVATGPAGHIGVLLASEQQVPTTAPTIPGLLEGGCDHIGLGFGLAVTLDTSLTANLTWTLATPNNASLESLQLHFQTLWFGASSPTFQLSNGLQTVIGTAAPH